MAFSRSSLISFFSLALFAVFNPTISSRVPSFIKLPSSVESSSSVASYCEGWKLAAETDNAGKWKVVPNQAKHKLMQQMIKESS
ncbi:unnamed protein product [Arabidopsis lyrata]|uniref:Uncharacterized protein n=1 Tax=Arabidopsis lyrata subsp. lyrata TaxID=81972 RepID=D7LBF5_ARALL|nr:hypothetical protein ARALYDRAFT_901218 [Arabidopsis lyrata subsp. lyrata]CAH8263566.1 unnamed protein product [Arabidopsis lyrata]